MRCVRVAGIAAAVTHGGRTSHSRAFRVRVLRYHTCFVWQIAVDPDDLYCTHCRVTLIGRSADWALSIPILLCAVPFWDPALIDEDDQTIWVW